MKRMVSVLLVLLLLLCGLPLAVSANAPGPDLNGEFTSSPTAIVLFLVISVTGIAFTCWIEWLVATPFDLREFHGKLIVATNLVSQVIMRVLQVILPMIMPSGGSVLLWYAGTVLVLEIFVCLGEYLFYRRKMRDTSWKRCLLYTVTANTASALGGLLLLLILI